MDFLFKSFLFLKVNNKIIINHLNYQSMKKVYTLMAAAAASLSMFAAPTQPAVSVNAEKALESQVTMVRDYTIVENNNGMMKAPATPDLNNYMAYTYRGRSSADADDNYCAIEMKQTSAT